MVQEGTRGCWLEYLMGDGLMTHITHTTPPAPASVKRRNQDVARSALMGEHVKGDTWKMALKANGNQPASSAVAPAAPSQSNLPATPVENITIADLNPLLQGLDGIGDGGNFSRIVVDGSEFLYKKLELRVSELMVPGNVIVEGKKYWQWWPSRDAAGNQTEEGGMCMSYDHKMSVDGIACPTCPNFKNKTCKLKYDLTFSEFDEDAGESKDHTFVQSTTSAISFIEYVKALAKGMAASKDDVAYLQAPKDPRKPQGANNGWVDFNPGRPVGLHEIVTRIVVKRVSKKDDKSGQTITWGQAVFQAVDFIEGVTA